jgi:hypothetical protein
MRLGLAYESSTWVSLGDELSQNLSFWQAVAQLRRHQ